uniref:BRCT domain-containing protein n=1 Tax=Emiliania huxleyi TaxID=2903 RepID=A0A6V2SM55_EMIHU|mmetsp:Transcript_10011/g.29825  ORF Transcript_10011/g.29825 Transcript_10011/m.29825 type:complete len:423 (+) Transcript_10011:1013-2281(+)
MQTPTPRRALHTTRGPRSSDALQLWFTAFVALAFTRRAECTARGRTPAPSSPCSSSRLRFPRVKRVRYDKGWEGAETFERVVELFKECDGRLSANKRRAEEIAASRASAGPAAKKRAAGVAPTVGVPWHLKLSADLANTAVECYALDGVVAVVKGTLSRRPGVETQIKRLGGKVHKNMTSLTTHLVDVDEAPGAEVLAEVERARRGGGSFEVVTAAWVDECSRVHARVTLEPRYVRHVSEATREQIEAIMDEWGDNYTIAADPESLVDSMRLVREQRSAGGNCGDSPLAREAHVADALRDLDDETAVALRTRYAMLRGVVAYVPRGSVALRLRLRLLGAQTVDEPSADSTHAVLSASTSADERQRLRDKFTEDRVRDGRPSCGRHIVSDRWLAECERRGQREPEAQEDAWFGDRVGIRDRAL